MGTTRDKVEVEPGRGTRRRDEFSCSRCLDPSFRVSCMRTPNQNALPTQAFLYIVTALRMHFIKTCGFRLVTERMPYSLPRRESASQSWMSHSRRLIIRTYSVCMSETIYSLHHEISSQVPEVILRAATCGESRKISLSDDS